MLRGPRVTSVFVPPPEDPLGLPGGAARQAISRGAFAPRPGVLAASALFAAETREPDPAPVSGAPRRPMRRALRRLLPDGPVLVTPRLLLRRPEREDLDEYAFLMANPDVISRTIDPSGTPMRAFTRDEAFAFAAHGLLRLLGHWQRLGTGPFAVCQKRRDGSAGGLLGIAGLRIRAEEVAPAEAVGVAAGGGSEDNEIELIYTLGRAYWGRGLGREMVAAAVADGFARLGVGQISAFTVPPPIAVNRDAAMASAAILTGLGFQEGPPRAGYGIFLRSFSLAAPAAATGR